MLAIFFNRLTILLIGFEVGHNNASITNDCITSTKRIQTKSECTHSLTPLTDRRLITITQNITNLSIWFIQEMVLIGILFLSNFADPSIKRRTLPIDQNSNVACLVYRRKFIDVDKMQNTR